MSKKTRTIKVDYLARVEGEGGLFIEMEGEDVKNVQLKIFEPPRFFESFLKGRQYSEAPDITARICGICPVAYQMSAVHAMEAALNIKVDGVLRRLRRLLYCGEWLESHVLHIAMLHAPDFLGFQDAIQMSKKHPQLVEKALSMKKAGNEIVRVLAGREIHPINVKIGGFHSAPKKKDLRTLLEPLKQGLDDSIWFLDQIKDLPFPELELPYEMVCLKHESEYPMNEGRIVSNLGLDITAQEYEEHFEEQHVAHSNALHSIHKGHGAYLVGPLARFNHNAKLLHPHALTKAQDLDLMGGCNNPFKSILIRTIEVIYAFEEAIQVVEAYERPDVSSVPFEIQAGSGQAATEAPRGLLYHNYTIDDKGFIELAKIVPPTSQNQKSIESDLDAFVRKHSHLDQETLQWKCEQAIRNYDPCISCATHFLKMHIKHN